MQPLAIVAEDPIMGDAMGRLPQNDSDSAAPRNCPTRGHEEFIELHYTCQQLPDRGYPRSLSKMKSRTAVSSSAELS